LVSGLTAADGAATQWEMFGKACRPTGSWRRATPDIEILLLFQGAALWQWRGAEQWLTLKKCVKLTCRLIFKRLFNGQSLFNLQVNFLEAAGLF
jgi:hypothetical protein